VSLSKLLTLSFERNVGSIDRILRIAIGATLIALPWFAQVPRGFQYGALIIGIMIAASGALGRCTVYYLLGYRTCPLQKS